MILLFCKFYVNNFFFLKDYCFHGNIFSVPMIKLKDSFGFSIHMYLLFLKHDVASYSSFS